MELMKFTKKSHKEVMLLLYMVMISLYVLR